MPQELDALARRGSTKLLLMTLTRLRAARAVSQHAWGSPEEQHLHGGASRTSNRHRDLSLLHEDANKQIYKHGGHSETLSVAPRA